MSSGKWPAASTLGQPAAPALAARAAAGRPVPMQSDSIETCSSHSCSPFSSLDGAPGGAERHLPCRAACREAPASRRGPSGIRSCIDTLGKPLRPPTACPAANAVRRWRAPPFPCCAAGPSGGDGARCSTPGARQQGHVARVRPRAARRPRRRSGSCFSAHAPPGASCSSGSQGDNLQTIKLQWIVCVTLPCRAAALPMTSRPPTSRPPPRPGSDLRVRRWQARLGLP